MPAGPYRETVSEVEEAAGQLHHMKLSNMYLTGLPNITLYMYLSNEMGHEIVTTGLE